MWLVLLIILVLLVGSLIHPRTRYRTRRYASRGYSRARRSYGNARNRYSSRSRRRYY